MFNIKKQILRLYASSLFSTLSLSGAWVAILSSRGFSLAQIGAAETVFHLVSLIFEIPSGALADVVGRKKTLLISCVMRIIANIAMIASNNCALVCVSIAFSALHYNCMSGSDDALAYDSLKSAGEEGSFERYASNQLVIYRVCDGLSTLTAGLALVLGYRIAYASGIFFSLVQGFFLCGLTEIRLEAPKEKTHLAPEILGCFAKSFAFLRTEKRIASFMFANSRSIFCCCSFCRQNYRWRTFQTGRSGLRFWRCRRAALSAQKRCCLHTKCGIAFFLRSRLR